MLQEEQPDQGLFFGYVNKIIFSIILITGGFLKDICGYFQCAPFPRLQTGKVVWVLSFDP